MLELLKAFRHNELFWVLKEFVSKFKSIDNKIETHEIDIKSLYLQIETLKEMIEKSEKTKSNPVAKKATKKG